MCEPTEEVPSKSTTPVSDSAAPKGVNNMDLKPILLFCMVVTLSSLAATIALAFKAADNNTTTVMAETPTIVVNAGDTEFATAKPPAGENPCAGKRPPWENIACVVDAMTNVGPQSGANVTKGYKGTLEVDHEPILNPYYMEKMCPVNVHWHLGAEHYSLGEFDENGSGPVRESSPVNDRRALAEEETRKGYQCRHYNEDDQKFTKPYVWKHCQGMVVGETYEVHWPHSAAGACGTLNQYQTPFYDGVFCRDGILSLETTMEQIGVQAQVFTIVNDENYYYPDLMRGMIVDGEAMGQDIAYYTGSTTGTTRDNELCSPFSPITWQVDRKCHIISASSFDKMCADMKAQRDDMTKDLYAHGSRTLVADHLAADNSQRLLRG